MASARLVLALFGLALPLPGCGETSASDSGATGSPSVDCANPVLDPATGYEACDDGLVHRPMAVGCELPTSVPACDIDMRGGTCAESIECLDGPNGFCLDDPSVLEGCGCVYSCATDADCGDNQVCACSGITGDVPRCVSATCKTDADCGEGLCGLSSTSTGCGSQTIALACLDQNSDCRQGSCDLVQECFGDEINRVPSCLPIDGVWSCHDDACGGNCG